MSERKLQAELNETRLRVADGVSHNAEIGIVCSAACPIWWPELRVVKDVKKLGAEFNVCSFADCCLLKHSKVEVIDALLAEGRINSRLIAESPSVGDARYRNSIEARSVQAWLLEARCIKPATQPRYGASGDVLIAPGDHIRPERRLTKEP